MRKWSFFVLLATLVAGVLSGVVGQGLSPAAAAAPPSLDGLVLQNDATDNVFCDTSGTTGRVGAEVAGASTIPYAGTYQANVNVAQDFALQDTPDGPQYAVQNLNGTFVIESTIGTVEGSLSLAGTPFGATCSFSNPNGGAAIPSGVNFSARIYTPDGKEYIDSGTVEVDLLPSTGNADGEVALVFHSSNAVLEIAVPLTLENEAIRKYNSTATQPGSASVTPTCSDSGSIISFTAATDSTDPSRPAAYPGPRQISGQLEVPNTGGPIATFDASFSMTTARGSVAGTIRRSAEANEAYCGEDSSAQLALLYDAVITKPDGQRYRDYGSVSFSLQGSGADPSLDGVAVTFESALESARLLIGTDTTNPVSTIISPTPGQRVLKGESLNAAFTCDDDAGGSGIDTCTGLLVPGNIEVTNGQSLPTSGQPGWTLTVTALDNHGNEAKSSRAYEIVPGSAAGVVGPGGTLSSPFNSSAVPAQTRVRTPSVGDPRAITIDPQGTTTPTDPNAEYFGNAVATTGPSTSFDEPYLVTLLAHPSRMANTPLADVRIFRDDLPVDACTDGADAVPDPCVASKFIAGFDPFNPGQSGHAVVAVRTSQLGVWNLGKITTGTTATVAPGQSVSTGTEATPADPVQTAIVTPSTGTADRTITITPQPSGTPTNPSFEFFGEAVAITGPPSTFDEPYELTFLIDSSALDGTAPGDVQIFRNGTPVADCTDPADAIPDPCVISRLAISGSDAQIKVRTSAFSVWAMGTISDPVAVNDSYTTPQQQALIVPPQGVLANDLRVEQNDTLRADIVNGASHGSVTLRPDGGFTYVPVVGFHGPDSFTYRATTSNDETEASNTGTVTISVTPRATTNLVAYAPIIDPRAPTLITLRVGATLRSGTTPVLGRVVYFYGRSGQQLCSGFTDSNGYATCGAPISGLQATLNLGYTVGFLGGPILLPSTGSSGLLPGRPGPFLIPTLTLP